MLKLVLFVFVATHEAMEDIVPVGGNHQLGDWQPHLPGQIPGKDVAEIAGGHRERHAAIRTTQRQRGMKVIHNLGHDPGPVDGVYRRQLGFAGQEGLITEALLHHALAIIKIAAYGNVVDILTLDGGHLPALDF